MRGISTIPHQVIIARGNGTMDVFVQPQGGAHFATPGSFGGGTKVAAFDVVFENVLTLTAPGQANVELSADLTQTLAQGFSLAGYRDGFGHVGHGCPIGSQWSGDAHRPQPAPARSTTVAGFVTDSGGASS